MCCECDNFIECLSHGDVSSELVVDTCVYPSVGDRAGWQKRMTGIKKNFLNKIKGFIYPTKQKFTTEQISISWALIRGQLNQTKLKHLSYQNKHP